jgi:hypothetical protein
MARLVDTTRNRTAIARIIAGRNALAGVLIALALAQVEQSLAQDSRTSRLDTSQIGTLELDGISGWLRDRFSRIELDALRPGDLEMESHFCSCSDAPRKHFPYAVVVLRTPKGDLVTRPEGQEGVFHFAALAVRHDDLYCDVESEADCFGTFAHPCEFTDFRYGRQLAEFFPTCKTD